jgi:CheY-like chemotaxis protein
MPDTNPRVLTDAIRKLPRSQALPLLLLTSLMGSKEGHSGLTPLPLSASVAKPIKPAQLLQTMLDLMSGAKPSTKAVAGSGKLDPSMAQRFPLRVLLCDDNLINQKVASRLLQQMGYRPDVVGNGLEALAALEKQRYDLIFMDVMMPEMNGLEATEAIRQRQKDPKAFPHYKAPLIIVAMTASAMQGDRERCLSAGMDDYIAKPVRPEDVRKTIEAWAPQALQPGVPVPSADPAAQSQDAPATDPNAPASETGPVDIDRLLEFTDGSPENLRELVELYLTQTTEQLEKLRAALAAADPAEVRRVAHSCAGASATCGMRYMVPLLRELERQGREGKLTDAGGIFEQTAREFQKVRNYLESRQVGEGDVAATN